MSGKTRERRNVQYGADKVLPPNFRSQCKGNCGTINGLKLCMECSNSKHNTNGQPQAQKRQRFGSLYGPDDQLSSVPLSPPLSDSSDKENKPSSSEPFGSRTHWRRSNSDNSYDLPKAFGSRQNRQFDDPVELESIVQEYFSKKFFFIPPLHGWHLLDPSMMFQDKKWEIPHMQKMKDQLNAVKNKLNDYNLDRWHKHTRFTNKAGSIQWTLRENIYPEFLTQAWCKFYENASSFNLVPPCVVQTKELNSVHLCEAPGAFITSLNHYLKKNFVNGNKLKWNWLATTLNPYYEGNPLSCMINDDRFIMKTLQNWTFGADYTGNLMDVKNLDHLVEMADKMGEVLLVTADGSIDCQEDPGEQENIVAPLHYCEAVSALHILAEGGSFLLKMFTFYEEATICLLYLLCCMFTVVNVCKPATSKEGNSEVYVVCLEYIGKEKARPWLDVLRKHFGPEIPSKAMFPKKSIPEDFLEQLKKCSQTFKNYQVEVIENNIRLFHEKKSKYEDIRIKKLKNMVVDMFLEKYEMEPLEEEEQVVGYSALKNTATLNLDPRTEEGSFNDRRKKGELEPVELLGVLQEEIESMRIRWPYGNKAVSAESEQDENPEEAAKRREENCIKWMNFNGSLRDFKIQTGKPVSTVHSSKFCLGRLLRIRNQVRDIAKQHFHYEPEKKASFVGAITRSRARKLYEQSEECVVKKFRDQIPELKCGGDTKLLEFGSELWQSMEGANQEVEREAFCDIMDTVDDLWREDNLIVQGYPMLSQFNVGIIYMLSHMFEKVGFMKPNKQEFAVVFIGYKSWNKEILDFLNKVDKMALKLKDAKVDEAVLAVLPITTLCEGEFYTCVTEINHLCVKEQVVDIIQCVLKKKSSK